MTYHFNISGCPRTKKNHSRIIHAKGRRLIVPSLAHETWLQLALPQLRQQFAAQRGATLAEPVAVTALFYRDADRGDLLNFEQAIADALQTARVLVNDRWIYSWDGSRLLFDPEAPRIDVRIATLAGGELADKGA